MSIATSLCSSPAASLAALGELFAWADELWLAYAWATSNAGQAKHWAALPLSKVKRAIIGTQFAQTEPAALRTFIDCGDGILKVVEDTGGVFHPKVVVGFRRGTVRALVGSSNFTSGGFGGNTELNVLMEGPATDATVGEVVGFLNDQWTHPRAFQPDEDWLLRYERAYETRPRPKPVPRGIKARMLVRSVDDLDIEWKDFYSLIEQQERRTLSNGYEIHVFDHPDASYLQEIETCHESFRRHPTFAQMPLADRKYVAGFGGTSGYFGSMRGAGNYKNMIIERPSEIGSLLDAVREDGVPTDVELTTYLAGATALHGVSFATATRLLIAKRPDRFVSVNGASRGRIKEVFGSVPATPERYLQLLKRIWAMPWFDSTEPDAAHERRVWRARVAILDAVMYDAT